MKKRIATSSRSCPGCGQPLGGPWAACSELCSLLAEAERELAGDTVQAEMMPRSLRRRAA